MIPDNLLYTKEHEWAKIDNDFAIIGITDYAQGELGDIVFVELPDVGAKLSTGDKACTIEAVKAVSEVYTPVSGEVVEINESLKSKPDSINLSPYGDGWMFKLKIGNKSDISKLVTPKDYGLMIGH
jgi:glycine cleavage system H protein